MSKDIPIRVIPRASSNTVVGTMANDTLKIRITSAPVNGKANTHVIELLSAHWHIPKQRITIVRGHTSKDKIVRIT